MTRHKKNKATVRPLPYIYLKSARKAKSSSFSFFEIARSKEHRFPPAANPTVLPTNRGKETRRAAGWGGEGKGGGRWLSLSPTFVLPSSFTIFVMRP